MGQWPVTTDASEPNKHCFEQRENREPIFLSLPCVICYVCSANQGRKEKKKKTALDFPLLCFHFLSLLLFIAFLLYRGVWEQYSSRRKESEKGNTLYWGGGQRQETEKWTFDFYSSKKLTFLFATSQRSDAYYCCLFFSYGLSSFPT